MDQNRFTIELEKPEILLNLVATMAAVSRKAGRGALAQAADLLRLRLDVVKFARQRHCCASAQKTI